MKSASASIYSLALFLAALTPAWAASDSSHTTGQGKHWLVEKSSDYSRFQIALLSGNTRYDGKTGEALLAISCHPDNPMSCLLYTSPSPRDRQKSRMPSSA